MMDNSEHSNRGAIPVKAITMFKLRYIGYVAFIAFVVWALIVPAKVADERKVVSPDPYGRIIDNEDGTKDFVLIKQTIGSDSRFLWRLRLPSDHVTRSWGLGERWRIGKWILFYDEKGNEQYRIIPASNSMNHQAIILYLEWPDMTPFSTEDHKDGGGNIDTSNLVIASVSNISLSKNYIGEKAYRKTKQNCDLNYNEELDLISIKIGYKKVENDNICKNSVASTHYIKTDNESISHDISCGTLNCNVKYIYNGWDLDISFEAKSISKWYKYAEAFKKFLIKRTVEID